MHDIRAIRENPELYEKAWGAKGSSGRVAEILALDGKLRGAQTAVQTALAARNESSKKIGQAKAQKNETEAQRLMAEVEGPVFGHRDGHGFVVREGGLPDLYLSPQEMRPVLHRDRVKARIVRYDKKGRPEGRVLDPTSPSIDGPAAILVRLDAP